ncbi:MAG: hypothetical protein GY796_06435, partial [Chloroflexi bacterium]|nr:hypothetical protein [Chloroflexota bacterium]
AHVACAGPSRPSFPETTATARPTPTQSNISPTTFSPQTKPIPSPTSAKIESPRHPLQAWHLAADGAVYILDAAYSLYHLSPADLSPLAKSDLLFIASIDTPSFLLVDDSQIFVGSRADRQTLILNRDDFSLIDSLNQAGPMALDIAGQRLFLVPERDHGNALNGSFVVYDLSDLNSPLLTYELSCQQPNDFAIQPFMHHLYVRTLGICASPPHQRETFVIYDLDTLTEVAQSDPQLGRLSRPAVANRAGTFFTTLYAKSGQFSDNSLLLLDSLGQLRNAHPALDGIPALSPDNTWLYLLRERGLWVFSADDMLLKSILFFDQSPPADLAVSPNGDTLYLFGNGWLSTLSTVDLQNLGIPSLSPFPAAWRRPT